MTDKKPRGFAALSPDAMRAVASQGGRVAHAKGTARKFSSEEARAAAHAMHARRRQRIRDTGGRVPQDDEAFLGMDQQ